jgi:hypothetical protein
MSIRSKKNSLAGILSLVPPKEHDLTEATAQLNFLSAFQLSELYANLLDINEVRGTMDTAITEVFPTRTAFLAEVRAIKNDAERCRNLQLVSLPKQSFVSMIFGSVDQYAIE